MSRKFNLQPWRAAKREAQRKEFVTITLALVILAILLCGVNYWLEKQYAEKQQEGILCLRMILSNTKKPKMK